MASPQPTDAHLRIAHSINEAVIKGGLIKSKAQRVFSLPQLIEKGIMPKLLPCDKPCSRGLEGSRSFFSCESCMLSKDNPFYYSHFKKQIIPEKLRWEVWERDNFTCLNCGARQYLTIDHIIPEFKGGKTELSNLQTLCRNCNARKGRSDA